MATALDGYQWARDKANAAVVERYHVHGPYEVGSECHTFWLKEMDYWFSRWLLKPKED